MSKIFYFLLLLTFNFNTLSAQNFSTHQVKTGETIQEISDRYSVSINDIYSLNPDAKKELKPNTILIIPISKATKPKVTTTKELQGFKEHKTGRKETLYSLAKKYDVTEDDIKKYNTFLYSNILNKGDKLQIPVFKITQIKEEKATTKPYIVAPKEGKWRIAYKFGITVPELEALNPNMGETLQEGQQIYVPNVKNSDEKVVDEKYSYYKVLPKEGFYRLKIKLNLEKEELELLNPGLKESGLKDGMVLKIPYTNLPTISSENEGNAVSLKTRIKDYNTKHIAVMLPFRLNRVEFDSLPDIKRSIKKDAYLDASLDFYSGVTLALDSLKALGVSLRVDVYDTKYQVSEVSKILSDNDFENVDAVIGPLTPETFDKVASELKNYNTPVISPIGTNLKLYDNVFQSRPSDDLLKSKIVNFVKSDSSANHIVIVSDSKNEVIANELKTEFNNAKMVFSRKNKSGNDDYYVSVESIRSALAPGKNIVFLETQNEGFVSNVVSILASLNQKSNSGGTEIIMVTTNMNSAFEGDEVSNDHLSRLQFHFASTSKSYSENENNSFVKKYKSIYHTTPNKRVVKGFDLTMDVVLRLVSANDIYASVNSAPVTEYVENKFATKRNF